MKKYAVILSFPIFMLLARYVPFNKLPPSCMFLRLSGYPCPTCGMTRSVMALAHFHFSESIRMNLLGPAFVAGFALWWGNSLYEMRTNRTTRLTAFIQRNLAKLFFAGLGILVLYGSIRIYMMAI